MVVRGDRRAPPPPDLCAQPHPTRAPGRYLRPATDLADSTAAPPSPMSGHTRESRVPGNCQARWAHPGCTCGPRPAVHPAPRLYRPPREQVASKPLADEARQQPEVRDLDVVI